MRKFIFLVPFIFFVSSMSYASDSLKSFSVQTFDEHKIDYNSQTNILTITAPDGSILIQNRPKMSAQILNFIIGSKYFLYSLEVFDENVSVKLIIYYNYYKKSKAPQYIREAILETNVDSRNSKSRVRFLQEFIPEQNRPRFKSFSAQTTNGGHITYDSPSRVVTVYNQNGDIELMAPAFYRSHEFGFRRLSHQLYFNLDGVDHAVHIRSPRKSIYDIINVEFGTISYERGSGRFNPLFEAFNLSFSENIDALSCKSIL